MPDNESVLFGSPDRTSIRIFRAFTDDRPVEPVTREPAGTTGRPSTRRQGDGVDARGTRRIRATSAWEFRALRAPRVHRPQSVDARAPSFAPQVVTWAGADGQQVEGLLYAPLQSRPGTRAPLLLEVHGGPAANHLQYFSPLQEGLGLPLLLQKGWAALLYPTRAAAPATVCVAAREHARLVGQALPGTS